jgi:DNA-binding transcriptional MocR family regulator
VAVASERRSSATHRTLAADERLSLATATRVYRELEEMGLVSGETDAGGGGQREAFIGGKGTVSWQTAAGGQLPAADRPIRSGQLPAGSRLPTHRTLAADERLSLATATRVYRFIVKCIYDNNLIVSDWPHYHRH